MSAIAAGLGAFPPRLEINPIHWSYLAEGGFHIILRYDGDDSKLQGKILRIGKKSLGHTGEVAVGGDTKPSIVTPQDLGQPVRDGLAASLLGDSKEGDSVSLSTDEAGARRRFEHGVLMPLLGKQYVQPGDAVTLSAGDIVEIHKRIDHLRPSGRLEGDAGHWSYAAQLEPDKTGFWLKVPVSTHDTTTPENEEETIISVELKPKGAVMPVGALVPPGPNRLKYRVSRFDAQQKYKAQGKQNWGTIDRPTGYHPRELYSGNARRVAATLKELMKTPQNKLRAWEQGTMLFGAGSGGDGEIADSAAGSFALAVKRAGLGGEGGSPADCFMDLVGKLLTREPLASNLAAAQALNVLEIEGGGLVFKRLVALCGDSKDAALDLLERKEAETFTAQPVAPALLLTEKMLASLRTASLESLKSDSAVEGMDDVYENALKAVEELSIENCVHLLRRYTIALGVMDCSIMISLKALPHSVPTAEFVQREDAAGVLKTIDGRFVAYCLSVVDAGPKPPAKISTKAKHESKIWEFVAELDGNEFVQCD